jgi:hypothetical protein
VKLTTEIVNVDLDKVREIDADIVVKKEDANGV